MTAYYNEIDPYAAQWLRNLIDAGYIAPGIVDERSIEDVTPADLAGFTQCHFFAGIGVWSYALRLAGWPDDRPVWTGSCPCQPFSAAGKGAGFADERHLWPYWFHLIQHGKPRNVPVFGEQVASKDGLAWLDLVHADLEGAGYAVGAFDLCAAGVGAPHIRQRLWFVAQGLEHAELSAQSRQRFVGGSAVCEQEATGFARNGMAGELVGNSGDTGMLFRNGATTAGGLADSASLRCEQQRGAEEPEVQRERAERGGKYAQPKQSGELSRRPEGLCRIGRMEHSRSERRKRRETPSPGYDHDRQASERAQSEHGFSITGPSGVYQDGPGPTNGFWRDADWLLCRDGRWRPVEARIQQMVDGVALRMGPLRPALQTQIEEVTESGYPNIYTNAAASFPLGEILYPDSMGQLRSKSRAGRLRAYGNCIVPQAAQAFIESWLDWIDV